MCRAIVAMDDHHRANNRRSGKKTALLIWVCVVFVVNGWQRDTDTSQGWDKDRAHSTHYFWQRCHMDSPLLWPPKGFNSQDKVGVSSEFTPKGSITPLRVHCTDCVEGWWRVVEVGAYDNGNVIKVYSVNPEVLVLIAQVNHLSITQHQCVTNPWIWLWIISNKLHPEVQLFVFLTEYRKKCVLLALLLFFCFLYVFFFWLSVNLCE